MSQHMSQDRAGDGVTAEPRSGRATGTHVLIPTALSEQVFDAAKKADFSPEAFVRNAVESALNVSDTEIDVTRLDHPGDTGHVTLSAPDYQTAKQRLRRTDAEGVDDWIQGVVRGRVQQTFEVDRARKQAEQAIQGAVTGAFIPAPDPFGVMEAATNGMVKDPIRALVENQQGR